MSSQRVRQVVDLAKEWVDQGITPALVVLAARRGIIVLHEAFGRLTPERDSPPVELDTIFPLASLVKPITAAAVMALVEDGRVGLNRPVWEYLPEFIGEGKHAVQVHHLLTHTAGLKGEDVEAHVQKKKGPLPIPPLTEETQHPVIHELLCLRWDAPLWKPPGTEMSYSNYSYDLLGEIVRRVSGNSLEGFAQERIFEPLGMKDSYYVVPESVRHRTVQRAGSDPCSGFDSRSFQETPWAAAGGFSTAMDMAIFGQAFLNRGAYGDARILSPASVAEMTRNQIPGISAQQGDETFPEASWGYGWSIHGNVRWSGSLHSPSAFAHPGSGSVYLWVDPVYEVVGVYFSVSKWRVRDLRTHWPVDLFVNAVTAAVIDV